VSQEHDKAWTIRNGDRLSSAVVLALGLYLVYESMSMTFGSVARPGPGFYPTVLAWLLVGMSAVMLVRSLRLSGDALRVAFIARTSGHIVFTIAAIVVYAAVLEAVGFLLCTLVLVLMLLIGIGKVPWVRSAMVAAVGTVVFYTIFTWLGIPLPKGYLAS
jgi:putative tricarboxylic transport membrane protein